MDDPWNTKFVARGEATLDYTYYCTFFAYMNYLYVTENARIVYVECTFRMAVLEFTNVPGLLYSTFQ
jgi:hypothetical protein